jgi:hypothetical protein
MQLDTQPSGMRSLMKNKLSVRRVRSDLADTDKRDNVLAELEALAGSEITDVLAWDKSGNVEFKGSDHLSARARKAIKKVKVTPNQFGQAIEIEMHDKLSANRLLAKHHGLLDPGAGVNRPSVIGINLTGPTTTYEVIDDKKLDSTGNGPDPARERVVTKDPGD